MNKRILLAVSLTIIVAAALMIGRAAGQGTPATDCWPTISQRHWIHPDPWTPPADWASPTQEK